MMYTPPPVKLAHAIEAVDHRFGFNDKSVVCKAFQGSAPGHYLCSIDYGRMNTRLGVQCLRAEFWLKGRQVHINWQTAAPLKCEVSHVPGA